MITSLRKKKANRWPHLCVDARIPLHTGIGRHVSVLLPFLQQHFNLTLLVNQPLETPSLQIQMKSRFCSFWEQFELPLKIPPCDLFWSPHFNIPLGPIRAKKRVVTIHDVYHLVHLVSFSLLKKTAVSVLMRSALSYSDAVITVSNFSATEMKRYALNPKSLEIVPNCNTLAFTSHRLSFLPKSYILYVGNFSKPHKNVKRLIEAHALLDRPPSLAVVGFHTKKYDLPPHVHYFGNVSDEELSIIYSHAELLVFPSTYEGFGVPPLEAMACHCPVVASNIAPIKEVCEDAVEYVDPFSVQSIKEGIERVLGDLRRREELIEKGKRQVEKYTAEKMAERFLKVINACCHRS